jgi:hypothetical protein
VNWGMYGVRYVRYWYVAVTLLRPQKKSPPKTEKIFIVKQKSDQ